MKVLMISGDPYLLDPDSSAYARLQLQRSQVEELDVFVWPHKRTFREILKAVKTNAYDVVTTQDPFWRGLLGLFVARRYGIRLNVQVHTNLEVQSALRRLLARIVLRRADSVRVVSEKIKRQVTKMGTRAPVHVLPIFVDLERFTQCERKPHAGKIIVWVGRFEDEKDPLLAVSVLEQVRASGVDAQLIMLGTGSLKDALQARARGLPVEFPGWQDSRPYLELADVVLVTSRYESWGASIVEALAARVPVVSLDVGVAQEAGARVVRPEELASAIVDILQNGGQGILNIAVSNPKQWAQEWKKTLS